MLEIIPIEINISKLKFISAGNLNDIIYQTNEAIYDCEIAELIFLKDSLIYELPNYIFDLVELKLAKYHRKCFLIQNAKSGSVVIGGLAAGLCIWFLNQTIGETLKEAWRESEWHFKIKSILQKRLNKRTILKNKLKNYLENNTFKVESLKTNRTIELFVFQEEDSALSHELKKHSSFSHDYYDEDLIVPPEDLEK